MTASFISSQKPGPTLTPRVATCRIMPLLRAATSPGGVPELPQRGARVGLALALPAESALATALTAATVAGRS